MHPLIEQTGIRLEVAPEKASTGWSEEELQHVALVLERFSVALGGLPAVRALFNGLTLRRVQAGAGIHYAGKRLITLGDGLFRQYGIPAHQLWGPRVAIAHELGHYWDWLTAPWWIRWLGGNGRWVRGLALIERAEPGPTWWARERGAVESWAETVAGYLFPEYFAFLREEAPAREVMAWTSANGDVISFPTLAPLHALYVRRCFDQARLGS